MIYDVDKKTEEEHVEIFKEKIIVAIDLIKNGNFKPNNQAEIINNKFSWKNFTNNWINLHEEKI